MPIDSVPNPIVESMYLRYVKSISYKIFAN